MWRRLLTPVNLALVFSVLFEVSSRHYVTTPSFLRDSVEWIPYRDKPPSMTESQRSYLMDYVFGTRSLPLRDAVESLPSIARYSTLLSFERVPLRDAVEKQTLPELSVAIAPPPVSLPFSWWLNNLDNMAKASSSQINAIELSEFIPELRTLSHYYGNKVVGLQKYSSVCFVEGWAVYRREPMKFSPAKDLDPFACTHLIYAFATLDPHYYVITPQDEEYDIVKGGYRSVLGLKKKNPNLKVMISIGGWVEGSRKFSQMAGSALSRREFIRSVLQFLDTYGFDGIDLDWEYPGAEDLGGRQTDKEYFALLVEELSEVFAPRGWLLSASVSPSRFRIEDGYDVPRLSKNLDFINLMAFDLHAERDSSADHHAPLSQRRHDKGLNVFYNVDYTVRYWLKKGASREKLMLGIPFYGRSFTLANSSITYPSAPVTGFGNEGKYTQEQGFLAYFEILELLEDRRWMQETDDVGSPYIVKGDQWIGYDNPLSVYNKMLYIKKNQLGGVMVWATDLDDFHGLYGEKWPLLSVVKNTLLVENKLPVTHDPVPVIKPPVAGSPVSIEQGYRNCTGQGFARDPTNCAVYYRCEWAMKHTYVCPEGLYYDTRQKLCNWPHLTDCNTPGSSEEYFTVPAALPTPPSNIDEALCTSDGMFGDPDDCHSYFLCQEGRRHKYTCARGQIFNSETGLCNYGISKQCGLTKIYDTSDEDTAILSDQKLIGEEDYKVVCYFTDWAWYRKGEGKFVPEHVDSRLCTHIVYAYAALDPNDLVIKPFDVWADIENNFYQRVTGLHGSHGGHGPSGTHSEVKVLLALGGWTDSSEDKYSKLVSDGSARRKFVTSVVSYLRRYNFGGLHLDWTYPRCWQSNCNKGPSSDKPNFTKLVQELKKEFQRNHPPLILAASISGYKEVIDEAYELPELGKYLDFMSVMTYDYHGSWEGKTGHVSPLYYRKGDKYPQFNTNFTMEYLVSKGAPRKKLLMGIPFYGQSFTLSESQNNGQGEAVDGPGTPGEYTRQPGMLSYYEICDRVKNKRWTVKRDEYGATGPYAHFGNQWVGYEDTESVREKTKFIKNMGYGGAMAWTIDLDDFGNVCCLEPYPLLRTVNRVLGMLHDAAPVRGDCTKPPEPVTPVPPTLTTGSDSGEEMWSTTPAHVHPTTSTTKRPLTTTSTTKRPPTTTRPWWSTTTTTTRRPTTTTTTTTTTQKPTTTHHPITTTRPWWETTTRTTTTKRPTTMTSTSTTESLGLPPGQCSPGEYYPDPSNCNAYYRCILGELRKDYCAGGLHWNAQTKVCDWPNEAKCMKQPAIITNEDDNSTPTSTTSTSQSWWSTTQTTPSTTSKPTEWWTTQSTKRPDWWTTTTVKSTTMTTTTSTTSTTSSSIELVTEKECVSGQYYPDTTSCRHYYRCVNNVPMRQMCATGLVWNQEHTMCDWSYNVKCEDNVRAQLTSRPVAQYASPDDSCDSGSYANYPGDCNRYMMCLFGQYKDFSCASGLHWNNEKQICDWPTNAKCMDSGVDMGGGDGGEGIEVTRPTVRPTPPPTTKPKPTSPVTQPSTVGMKPTRPPPTDGSKPGHFKIVCYFTNWAWYRPGAGKYLPEDIDENLCTHIVYGFAVLDYENLIVKAHDSWADFDNKFYERVVAYKKKGLKVSLALGGWNDSAGDKYSRLVNSPSARRRFIKHVLEFLDKYNFDGLDLDWEYPKCWQVDCNKGPDSDKQAFADFVRELRQAFSPRGLLLSSAVTPSKTVIDAGYDVKALGENLDWVAVMTYDFHGQWDKKTGHVAPLYFHEDDDFYFFNANYSINYWISEGVPRRKIVMGMPLYGQSFTLAQASTNGLNARAPGPGQAGEFTRAAGFLAYYEICDRIKNRGWTVVKDPHNRMGPYAFHGNQWVSFDDAEMIRLKSEYIRSMDLGGGMIWALDLDDFRNKCGDGPHPLLNTIRSVLTEPSVGGLVEQSTIKPMPPKPTKPPVDMTSTPTVTTTKRPSYPGTDEGTAGEFKVVCYFTNWAWYRQGVGKFLPQDIDPDLCTHIIYGFAVLNGDQLLIKPHDTWADYDNKFYEKLTEFKTKGIKVLLAIGGWNDSAGDKYSRLVNSPGARARFITNVIDFLEKNNFDGLDLDWEYPKCWQVDCNKGPDSDKQAFASFIKEINAAFKPKGLLLSAAVSPSRTVINAGYDVPALSQYLDWISVMTYDYHGQWDKVTGHVAPMYPHPEDVDVTFNSNFSIHYWIKKGADPKKIIMGMPMYGQSFSLADNGDNGLNAPTYGGGEAGEETRARGFLAYYEICTNIQRRGWTVVKDKKNHMGPYAYSRDQWVSFDDAAMIRHKSEFVRDLGLGGGMIWALDLDDFKNICNCESYPLLRTINRVLRGYPGPDPMCDIPADENKLEHLESDINNLITSPEATESPPPAALEIEAPACGNKIFSSHPNDCNKYYLCQFGQFMEQSCPSGLYWNKDHCDWPENTECGPGTDSITTTSQSSTTSTQSTSTWKPDTTSHSTTVDMVTTARPTMAVKPTTQGTIVESEYKVVCYFTNWAWYRQGIGKYTPSDIDASLCTHIAYGFAVLDGSRLTIKPHDSWADIDNEFYRKLTDYKQKGIKVVVAIGGWNDSLGDKYSRLVNNPAARQKFIEHVIQFIQKYNFDGLDLDWEYPKCWQVDCTKGPDSDKQGFAALVKELSTAFKPHGLLLSSAVSPSKVVIDMGYEVPTLSKYFDWISVMTYDFHGHWDKQTGHVAPLYYYPGDTYDYFNANFTIHYWLQKGADRKKIIMGMPLYGQSFSLADSQNTGLNSKTYGPGEAGEFTRAGGFLAYYEICHNVKNKGWNTVRDPEGRIGPYAHKGNQWVSYDDVSDIRRKSKFIKSLDLGGGMIWALDLDDFRNRCGCGTHPLLRTINHELRNIRAQTSDCT